MRTNARFKSSSLSTTVAVGKEWGPGKDRSEAQASRCGCALSRPKALALIPSREGRKDRKKRKKQRKLGGKVAPEGVWPFGGIHTPATSKNKARLPPSSETSSSNRWEHRDPQPDLVQRVRDFETLSPKWAVSITSLPSGLREAHGRGGRKSVRGKEAPKKWSSKSTLAKII